MKSTKGMWMVRAVCVLLLAAGGGAVAAEKPGALRTQIVKAEDAYFALYNQLNTDHQYDVVCRKEKATGTNFLTRVCKPRYMEKANQAAAAETLRVATLAGETTGMANSRGPNVGATVATASSGELGDKQEALRKNMLEVLQKSPELQALGKKRDELQVRLEAATKGSSDR